MATNLQGSFTLLDWLVVLAYLLVVIGIGFWAARGQQNKRDYFLGGRELPWWVVGLSILATETSALTFIGVPAIAIGGLSFAEDGSILMAGGALLFIQLMLGYFLGRLIIAIWIVPYYFTGDVYTPYQLLTRAFGKGSRYTAGVLSFIGIAMGAGVRVFVTAIPVMIVMRVYFPDWNISLSIAVIMLAAMLYTAIGGIKAVVWTDMIQYFIFVFGGLFALFYVPSLLNGDLAAPSGATGWGAVSEVSGGAGVLDWFRLGFVPMEDARALAAERLAVPVDQVGGLSLVSEQLRQVLIAPENILMGLIPTTIGIVFAFGFDQLNVQRVLGCRGVTEGRKAIMLSAILILPQFLLFLMIGAVLYAFYQLNGMNFGDIPPWDPGEVDPETGRGPLNASFVFPIFIVQHIPVIMKGFLVAGILAAAMSSVSSAISAMASISVMDMYRPLVGNKDRPAAEELMLSRGVSLGAGLVLAAIAWASSGSSQVIDLAFTVAGLTAGAILGAFVYGLIHKKGHEGPVIAGMVISFIVMAVFWQLRVNGVVWNVHWPWHTPIGMVICLVVIYIGHALIGKPVEGRDMREAGEGE